MGNGVKGRIWWWLMVIAAIAGVSYFIYTQIGREQPKKPKPVAESQKAAPAVTRPVLPESAPVPADEKKRLEKVFIQKEQEKEEAVFLEPYQEEGYCEKTEREIADFFSYLDQKQYVKQWVPDGDSYARFKKILKRSSGRPPVPAGEGKNPEIIVKNIYHFFRVLGRKDISLMRKVMGSERDSMEYNLKMFYRWITLDERCPDPEDIRPSVKVRYQYAGFFLNTVGGRAYLFRRAQDFRLLVSFYCVLIVHDADKKGENRYGIDLLPHILPLKEEINRYEEFEYQQEYLMALDRIEDYYNQRR